MLVNNPVDNADNHPPAPSLSIENALREVLGKPPGAELTKEDLARVTHLDLSVYYENTDSIDDQGIVVLADCINLQVLNLRGLWLDNIWPLSELTALTELNLEENSVYDIRPLMGLVNLRKLNLSLNPVGEMRLLAGLPNLTELTFSQGGITAPSGYPFGISNLNQFAELVNLQFLDLSDNRIIDLTPLTGLKNLEFLNLSDNRIIDLTPLIGLKNLKNLNLESNDINHIGALSGLTHLNGLMLSLNHIVELKPLVENPGFSRGDIVNVRGNPLSDASLNEHIPALEARGVIVTR